MILVSAPFLFVLIFLESVQLFNRTLGPPKKQSFTTHGIGSAELAVGDGIEVFFASNSKDDSQDSPVAHSQENKAPILPFF